MAHIKIQMDSLAKLLLFGIVKIVKLVYLYNSVADCDSDKEAYYINNHGVLGLMSKETKVRTIEQITTMKKLV